MNNTINREQSREYLKSFIKNLGGQKKVAQLFDVTQGAVSGWLRRGIVPIKAVNLMSKILELSKHDIRPDIYTKDD